MLPEWRCPACGAVTRARMADATLPPNARDRAAAEWLARTLISANPSITVGVLDNGEVRVEYSKGAYNLTIRTTCRFCGEPESDTVWCCDARMEAAEQGE